MRISVLPSETQPVAELADVSWSALAAGLLLHVRRAEKLGFELISPAIYKDNCRNKTSVLSLSFLMLDLDHLPRARAEQIWTELWSSGLAHVVYSTYRHGLDGPDDCRFRVVLPYSREVTPTEHLQIWDHFQRAWPDIDPKCREVSRAYFLPECRPDAQPFAWTGPSSQMLDVDVYIMHTTVSTSPTTGPSPGNRQTPVAVTDQAFLRVCRKLARGKGNTAAAFDALAKGLPFAAQGERDQTAFAMAQDLAREFPTASAESLAKHFMSSLSIMALDCADGALTLEAIKAKLQRALERVEQPPTIDLLRSSSGNPIACAENLRRVLTQDPEVCQAFCYNEFDELVDVMLPLPWAVDFPRALRDQDLEEMSAWLMRKYRLNVKNTACLTAIDAAARHHTYHPVRNYLDEITWDNIPRIDTWTSDLLGCTDTPYTRMVGAWWLMQACARVLATKSGVQADYTLILEGRQGIGKSQALRALAGDWFTSNLSNIESKDSLQELSGKWIIELAELSNVRKADTNALKNFLTRQDDTYRVPYGRLTRRFIRHCVFAGTTNDQEYMLDPTGARRYWPIECGPRIDAAKVKELRDQLWAEAYARMQSGERYWPETDENLTLLAVEAAKREQVDTYTDKIDEWLDKPLGYHGQPLTTSFLAQQVCGLERATRADDARVVQCLIKCGFKRDKHNRRYWVTPRAFPEHMAQVIQLGVRS